MQIISLNQNCILTNNIAKLFNVQPLVVKNKRFSLCEVELTAIEKNLKYEVLIIYSINKQENINEQLLKLIFLINYIKKEQNNKINLLLPYLPYSRQKREFEYLINILKKSGCEKIYTFDLHNNYQQTDQFIENIKLAEIIDIKNMIKDFTIIYPDEGSYLRYNLFFQQQSYQMIKTRIKNTVMHKEINFPKGRYFIIDDIIDSGQTIISTLKKIEKNSQVIIYSSHLVQKNIKNLLKSISGIIGNNYKLITTNSIKQDLTFTDKFIVNDLSAGFYNYLRLGQ